MARPRVSSASASSSSLSSRRLSLRRAALVLVLVPLVSLAVLAVRLHGVRLPWLGGGGGGDDTETGVDAHGLTADDRPIGARIAQPGSPDGTSCPGPEPDNRACACPRLGMGPRAAHLPGTHSVNWPFCRGR
jgi:hypothetical protein